MIVVRPGAEEAIKSGRTRQFWREKLRDGIADALTRGGIEHELRLSFGRVFVVTSRVDEALGILPYVFGVSTFSPVRAVAPAEMDEIVRIGKAACHDAVRGRTYAVRCGRQGGHAFSSVDVERMLGAALNEDATVNLDAPEVTVRVEVLGGRAVITDERRQGAGGLPAGMQGRALALLSGGYDSAVAAWRTMRRGVELDFLLCNLGGAAQERMVLQVAKFLHEAWGHGQQSRFHVLDFRPVMADIRAHIRPGIWQVALKRQMYRAGCRVAAETKAEALVTGEAIGQVSSQTLGNLQAIEPVADRPVLRPLLGFDKQEILDAARAIGTAPLSERVRETCALAGGRPAVRSRPGTLERAEVALDPALLAHGVEGRKVLDLRKVTPDELRQPYLFVRDISEDAVVIDCQPRHMYRAWHAPRAEHWEADRLARDYRRLPREKTYVLYCTFGTQTPVLAELMQQAGYEAYAFEGGLSRVQACVEGKETEAVRRAV